MLKDLWSRPTKDVGGDGRLDWWWMGGRGIGDGDKTDVPTVSFKCKSLA
jgi:hypothetical protein